MRWVLMLVFVAFPVSAQQIPFADWTSIDPATGRAVGTLDGVQVRVLSDCMLPGRFPCGLVDGVTTGTFGDFADPTLFAVSATATDMLGIIGGAPERPAIRTTFDFTSPVRDPVLVIENLASRMVIEAPVGTTLVRLSGDDPAGPRPFTLTGSAAQGTLFDCTQPCRVDSAGEIRIVGLVEQFSITARWETGPPGSADGIQIQLAGLRAPMPDAGVLDATPEPDATSPVDVGVSSDATLGDAGFAQDAAPTPEDAASTAADAMVRRDAAPAPTLTFDAAAADALEPTTVGSGCGCSTSAPGPSREALLVLLGMIAVRRRRAG